MDGAQTTSHKLINVLTLSQVANNVVDAPLIDAQYIELKLFMRPSNSIVNEMCEPYDVTRLWLNALPGIVQYT